MKEKPIFYTMNNEIETSSLDKRLSFLNSEDSLIDCIQAESSISDMEIPRNLMEASGSMSQSPPVNRVSIFQSLQLHRTGKYGDDLQ